MQPKFKRFYTAATLAPGEGGATLMLDGKPVKTPAGRALAIAPPRLAEAVAAEWHGAGETVELAAMPMTRLAIAALDHAAPRADALAREALAYAATDLLCLRADAPASLATRQHAAWQPHLDWAADTFGARLAVSAGVIAPRQDEAAIAVLAQAISDLDPLRLLALHVLTSRCGSFVLALAVIKGRIAAPAAFEASRLDEIFQEERWGIDAEAAQRTARLAAEIADIARFLALLD